MIASNLDTLSDQSRIWIYQSSRELNEAEIALVNSELSKFIQQWNSHGKDLSGSFDILNNLFVILAVDEEMAGASGCSIDSSVHLMKELGASLNIDFLNKSIIAYLDNGEIKITPFNKIKDLVETGLIAPKTPIFDLSITKLQEYISGWPRTASDTWISKYF